MCRAVSGTGGFEMLAWLPLAAAHLTLTSSSFYQTVASGRTFVFFHSPDCGYCRQMMPLWDALAAEPLPDGIRLATVDAIAEPSLAERFDVYGFPTLLLLDPAARRLYEYHGERTVESLRLFLDESHPQGFLSSANPRRLPRAPSAWDPLLDAPHAALDVLAFAWRQGLLACLLLACGGGGAAALAAAARAPPPPQFVMVTCPRGVAGGARLEVAVPAGRGWLSWRRAARRLTVEAPAGIAEGQAFFVPLVPPTAALVLSSSPAPGGGGLGDPPGRAVGGTATGRAVEGGAKLKAT
ncbi:hypothetical protein AB1Y20_007213 [Prymnesium parvum]|uniref:Thioredoxin domain-containing protein n=1 Tax=Prymnesium parvum TaxID=97485 RepID=A0AB34IWH9_PRYPA